MPFIPGFRSFGGRLLKLPKWVSHFGGYGFAATLPKALGLLFLPIYTRHLSETEYGIYALAELYAVVATTVLFAGVPAATTRLAMREGVEKVGKAFIAFGALVASSCFCLGLLLSSVSEDFQGINTNVIWGSLATLGLLGGTQIILGLQQALDRVRQYTMISVIQSLTLSSFALAGIVFTKDKLVGFVWGRALAALVAVSAGWLLLRRSLVNTKVDFGILRPTLVFALPLIVHQFSALALNAADRLILDLYLSPAEVGLYSVTYTVASAFSVLTATASLVLAPVYYRNARPNPDLSAWVLEAACCILSCLGLTATLVLPWVFVVFFPVEYSSSEGLIVWLVGGFMAHASFSLASIVALENNATRLLASTTIFAALANIILNFALVPEFGMIGAAISTLIAFLIEVSCVSFSLRDKFDPKTLRLLILGSLSCALIAVFPYLTLPVFLAMGGWLAIRARWLWRSKPLDVDRERVL